MGVQGPVEGCFRDCWLWKPSTLPTPCPAFIIHTCLFSSRGPQKLCTLRTLAVSQDTPLGCFSCSEAHRQPGAGEAEGADCEEVVTRIRVAVALELVAWEIHPAPSEPLNTLYCSVSGTSAFAGSLTVHACTGPAATAEPHGISMLFVFS